MAQCTQQYSTSASTMSRWVQIYLEFCVRVVTNYGRGILKRKVSAPRTLAYYKVNNGSEEWTDIYPDCVKLHQSK